MNIHAGYAIFEDIEWADRNNPDPSDFSEEV